MVLYYYMNYYMNYLLSIHVAFLTTSAQFPYAPLISATCTPLLSIHLPEGAGAESFVYMLALTTPHRGFRFVLLGIQAGTFPPALHCRLAPVPAPVSNSRTYTSKKKWDSLKFAVTSEDNLNLTVALY